MPEVLSEYFGDHNKKAQVRLISSELGKTQCLKYCGKVNQ